MEKKIKITKEQEKQLSDLSALIKLKSDYLYQVATQQYQSNSVYEDLHQKSKLLTELADALGYPY